MRVYREQNDTTVGLVKPRQNTHVRVYREGIMKDRIIEELIKIAFANISDAVEWGAWGMRIKPGADLNLFDIKVTKNTLSVKLRYNRIKALSLLYKCLKLINTSVDERKVIEFKRDCVEFLKVA